MSKKKRSLSEDKIRLQTADARYLHSWPRVLESIEQLQKKEGPIYERWKEGMKAWFDSLENPEV